MEKALEKAMLRNNKILKILNYFLTSTQQFIVSIFTLLNNLNLFTQALCATLKTSTNNPIERKLLQQKYFPFELILTHFEFYSFNYRGTLVMIQFLLSLYSSLRARV